MKNIIKIALLPVLSVVILTGCSMMQTQPMYQLWQNQAYSAYGMVPPVANAPTLIQATLGTWQPRPATYSLLQTTVPRAAPLSASERQYVAQYYSLQ